ncbi:MAG: sulfatase [Verrucomicrobiales bacterium]|nr:sulfatase [Verrucomicrobiales bacterium]
MRCPCVFVLFLLASTVVAAEPPNLLFILADDLSWSDPGCYGNEIFETPRLDQLAAEGMRFTQAYAAAPICSASRAATLTGKTPARLGFEFVVKPEAGYQEVEAPLRAPPYTLDLPLEEITIAELLSETGYETAFFGKWHLNQHYQRYLGWSPTHGPKAQGFEVAGEDFGSHPYSYWSEKEKRTFRELPQNEFVKDGLTERAVNFIRQDHDRPFFLMVSHFYVHDPIHTQVKWLHDHYQKKIPADHPRREVLAHYGAMVTALDHYIGQLLDALDASGLRENTLVIFTSDNGGHPNYAGNAPLRGSKWNLYEGGIRVPMIVRWPATIPGGTTTETPVASYDLFPTFAALAGLPEPEGLDGIPFAGTLANPDTPAGSRSLFWHFPYYHPEGRKFDAAPDPIGIDDGITSRTRPQSAIRKGEWKLIHFHEEDRDELYRIDKDLSEEHDLSSEEEGTRALLRGELFDYLKQVEARLPTRNE